MGDTLLAHLLDAVGGNDAHEPDLIRDRLENREGHLVSPVDDGTNDKGKKKGQRQREGKEQRSRADDDGERQDGD